MNEIINIPSHHGRGLSWPFQLLSERGEQDQSSQNDDEANLGP